MGVATGLADDSAITAAESTFTLEDQRVGSDGAVGWAVPGLLFASALVFFVVSLLKGTSGDLLSAVALAITAIPFLFVAIETPGRLLHPLSLFGFTMVLGVAGQMIYLTHGHPAASTELLSGLSPNILNQGILVVGTSVIALGIGYFAASSGVSDPVPGRLLSRSVRLGLGNPDPRRVFWVGLALCGISLTAFGLYAQKIGLSSLSDLLSSHKRYVVTSGHESVYGYYRFVISLADPVFVLLIYVIIRNRLPIFSRLGALALGSMVLVAGYATITSSRTELFATVAVAGFMGIALRRREPRVTVIVGVMVAAIACLTLLGGLRAVGQGEAPSLSSRTSTDALLENAVGNRDWMDIAPISVLINRVPQAYPYQYGKTLVSILWEPIPRSLWPGKPPVRIGPVIGAPVFGFRETRVTGEPPGIVGELWLNGGIFFVIIGMVLLGAVIRWVERLYRLVGRTNGLSAIPYGVLIVGTCLQLPITDVTGVSTSMLESLVTLAILLRIVRRQESL